MSWRLLFVLLIFVISASSLQAQSKAVSNVQFISPDELKAKFSNNESLTIIDVRGAESYAASTMRIKGAIYVKVRRLKSRLAFAPLKDIPKDREVVTYCSCHAEESSIAAAQILMENGFKRVRALKGGWQEWLKISGPVEQRPKGD